MKGKVTKLPKWIKSMAKGNKGFIKQMILAIEAEEYHKTRSKKDKADNKAD